MTRKNIVKTSIAIAVAMVISFIPIDFLGFDLLSIVERRLLAIFAFAAIMWISEAIPIWTTSIIIILLMLFTVSNNCLIFLREGYDPIELGNLVPYQSIMATFADPTLMLFLGGFVLAITLTRCGIDVSLAKMFLRPFGDRSEMVLLGFMIITATFSMFMSNTATTAMMLAIVAPIIRAMPYDRKGNLALTLAIPISANLGGIITPIGTPPNSIALNWLNNSHCFDSEIGFFEWVIYMAPLAAFLIFISWLILIWLFPFKSRHISIDLPRVKVDKYKSRVVYITFLITVLLWILDSKTGLNAYIIGMLPIGVFCLVGIIGKEELKSINWDVLWLVAGGFALGVGFDDTQLANHIINNISFSQWHPLLLIVGAGLICYCMSIFLSNTATAALLIPILGIVAKDASGAIQPYGGVMALILGIAVSASLAMVLPISTPPNALAHAMGTVSQRQMAIVGTIIGFIGLIVTYLLLFYLGSTMMALY